MKLQKTLSQNQRDEIRRRYEEHIAFLLCERMQETYSKGNDLLDFSDAEIFYNVMEVLDEVMTNPEPYRKSCKRLKDDLYHEFRSQSKGEPTKEAEAAMGLVMMAVNLLLLHANIPMFRTTIADNLFRVLYEGNEKGMAAEAEGYSKFLPALENELRAWMQEYGTHDGSISEEMEEMMEPKKKKKRTTVNDCCFKYHNKNGCFKAAMEELYNTCVIEEMIAPTTTLRTMELLFIGQGTTERITWTGNKHILTWVVKGWMNSGVVTCVPENTSHWDVVSQRFVDASGHHLPNISTEKKRKGSAALVEKMVRALTAYQ